MRKAFILTGFLIVFLILSPLLVSAEETDKDIKIVINVNPKYFNIVITDEKVIESTKTYLKNAEDFEKAQEELLIATLKTVVESTSYLVPSQILFTQDSVVFEYTYNPKFVYEGNNKLVLPEIKLKSLTPISTSHDFVAECYIYTKESSESCKYTIDMDVKELEFWDKLPRITYIKEPVNLNQKYITIFVDSTGNVLVISPEYFSIHVNGNCKTSTISAESGKYIMSVCKNISYIDFPDLGTDKYTIALTYNKDNTGVFKIDSLSYKVITYIRNNVKIEKETVLLSQASRIHFEKMYGNQEENNKSTLLIAGFGGIVVVSIVVVLLKKKKGNKNEGDIFE